MARVKDTSGVKKKKSYHSCVVESWQDSKRNGSPGEMLSVCYIEDKKNLFKKVPLRFQTQDNSWRVFGVLMLFFKNVFINEDFFLIKKNPAFFVFL